MDDATFKEKSRKVAASLRDAGGYKKAIEEINKFVFNYQILK